MTDIFKYSVLKYVHSQFLGEELNIGIVFLFPTSKKIIFQYPKNLNKFKYIYSNFPETSILNYLISFEEKSKLIDFEITDDNLDKILNAHFLLKESAPLQFTESKTVLLYSSDLRKIVSQYFNLYFPEETLSNIAI